MKEFTKDNFKEVMNKQLNIAGYVWKTYNDLVLDKDWLNNFTTTKENEQELLEYLVEYFKPFVSKYRLEKEVRWFILNYWFKVVWK